MTARMHGFTAQALRSLSEFGFDRVPKMLSRRAYCRGPNAKPSNAPAPDVRRRLSVEAEPDGSTETRHTGGHSAGDGHQNSSKNKWIRSRAWSKSPGRYSGHSRIREI